MRRKARCAATELLPLLFAAALACARTLSAQAPAPADSLTRERALDSLLRWRALDTLPNARPIGFREFLASVAAHNLDYAAQKYNVSIAQAQITVAKLYSDPQISFNWIGDITPYPNGPYPTGLSDQPLPTSLTVGASQTILLGGKIGARSDVAEQNENTAEAQSEDFFRNLRNAAAQAYIAAFVAESSFVQTLHTYDNLAGLVRINQLRLGAGDVGRIDYLQSRVDAIEARGAVLQADATRRQAFIQLAQLMGKRSADMFYRPAGVLVPAPRAFNLDTLIARAQAARPDVLAARRALDAARLGIDLAHAERWPDVTVGAWFTYLTPSNNYVAPSPLERTLQVGVSLPLPVSAIVNQGTLQAAQFAYEQAQATLASAKLKAETDVRQAYAQYLLAQRQYAQYSGELLADAEKVRQARFISYKAGGAPLVDVLTAENTLESVYLAYYSALAGYTGALVTLEQAAGMWDIEF